MQFPYNSTEDRLNCDWSKCAWHASSQYTLKSADSHSPSLHWLLQEDVSRTGCIQDWFRQSDWLRRGWPGASNIPLSICKTQNVLHCCHLVETTVMSAKQNAEHILVCLSRDKVGRDAETDLLMLPKGQLITTFVTLSVYYQLGNVNGPSGSCDSPVPFFQIRGSEYEIIAKRRRTSSWSLCVTKYSFVSHVIISIFLHYYHYY